MTNLNDRQADKYNELVEVLGAAQVNRKIGAVSPLDIPRRRATGMTPVAGDA